MSENGYNEVDNFVPMGKIEQIVLMAFMQGDTTKTIFDVQDILKEKGKELTAYVVRRYISILTTRGILESRSIGDDKRMKYYSLSVKGYIFASLLNTYIWKKSFKTWERL